MEDYEFLQNKYCTWYFNIIQKAKSQDRIKKSRSEKDYIYYENHHILPSCLGGNDLKENLVLLLAKEHFICHLLLCKMTKGSDKCKMVNALIKMQYSKSNLQERYTSKSYAVIKRLISDKNSFNFKGKKQSQEHLQNRINSLTGIKRSKEFGEYCIHRNHKMWAAGIFSNLYQPRSEETKRKISQSLIGKPCPLTEEGRHRKIEATKKSWQDPEKRTLRIQKMKGKAAIREPSSLETRKKISSTLLQKSKALENLYLTDPRNCENCGTILSYKKRGNNCCSKSCARKLKWAKNRNS